MREKILTCRCQQCQRSTKRRQRAHREANRNVRHSARLAIRRGVEYVAAINSTGYIS